MAKTKKISTILPADLLKKACELSKSNQTDTLIQALNELIGSYKREKLLSLHGKIPIKFEADRDRERTRL